MKRSRKVIIISQYSMFAHKRNMNAYQRIFYGAQHAEVHLLLRRKAVASDELQSVARVHHAPVHNRWLFLVYAMLFCAGMRIGRARVILTEPSGFCAVGFVARMLFGYRWIMDVWDRPRWRTGQHEQDSRVPLSDRLVFFLMRHANLYLMSVLPPAAKDIRPDPARSVQLYNAIDQSLLAAAPPVRTADPRRPLRLAYARSQFWETMGLNVLVDAVQRAVDQGVNLEVHLVGLMPDGERALVEKSPAGRFFRIHGHLERSRIEFFRTIDVGLVPYLDFEDLKYIFPIKVLEHLSQGNPVIVSRLPGLCRMVEDGVNGLVVPPGDAAALAAAMARLYSDVPLYNRLAAQALVSIRQFDVRKKHEEIFNAIFAAEQGQN